MRGREVAEEPGEQGRPGPREDGRDHGVYEESEPKNDRRDPVGRREHEVLEVPHVVFLEVPANHGGFPDT